MSDSAFTSAEVFTYVTTGAPGYRCRSSRTSAPVIEDAREHPASRSGIRTVFSGLRIFAVSAMKWTPANTITSASDEAPFCASASESPVTSATPWKISGVW
jgi:hypothetical protein